MKCDTPFWVLPKAALEKVPVPCGKCPNCKRRRVDSWVFRMLQEDKVSTSSYFITLTYDTRFVPISENGFMTLRKSDFQDYMKRLRKLCVGDQIKYYAVGEYGTQKSRPHYHAIVFNVTDPANFERAWMLGGTLIGRTQVDTVTGDSIAYVVKYIDKSIYKRKHSRDDRVSEFSLMSKRLGASYLSDQVVRYHKADLSRLYVTRPGGFRSALPRYYREKIYTDEEKRKQVEIIQLGFASQELAERLLHESLYVNDHGEELISFEARQESAKFARYHSFYHRLKKRKL